MKNKPIFIIILTIIIIAGISFFVIRPVVSSIFSSWKDLSSTRLNLQVIKEKTQALEVLKNNQNLDQVADIAKNYIPKETESGQLIIELTAMARTNNLKVEETSLEKSKNPTTPAPTQEGTPSAKATPTPAISGAPVALPGVETVGFSIKLAGAFADFMNFLKTIETSTRLISMTNISMQINESADKTLSFSTQISGLAYYKKEIDLTPELKNIEIAEATMSQFLNLKTYGQPIDLPIESGFGRTNPFENY